ncbi:hypothetical protein M0R04_03705 [Candidatus Dojkabacteria bacterium]|jgi:glycosyltransferase involved in cell wall biosynthesis|nr:hypothetical protein [Candidatus Dojkabacteria bacterium]
MEIEQIYKIADSKDSYSREEIISQIERISEKKNLPKFVDKYSINIEPKFGITILFPIFNEEPILKFSINSFLNSYFNPDISYQIIFFLNACTDDSLTVLLSAFKTVGEIETRSFSTREYKTLGDSGIKLKYFEIKNGRNIFKIIETSTRGRVNAIKVVCKIGKLCEHDIVMSFDTDFILEPQTIYALSNAGITNIIKTKSTVALSGYAIMVNKKKQSKFEMWLRDHEVWSDQKYKSLSGCSLVLNIDWALRNIVDVSVEDYAMGAIARLQNKVPIKIADARLWGFKTNMRDDIKQLSRSIRGRYQLLKVRPELTNLIISDHFFMQSSINRFRFICNKVFINPSKLLKCIWLYVFTELSIREAKKEFKTNSLNSEWEPLKSGR